MKLGYDLTIKQTQNLVMTPELIQAIQILQFNTQELESYVQEQPLPNPLLETEASTESREEGSPSDFAEKESVEGDLDKISDKEWQEALLERYDDISYKQWEQKPDNPEYTFEQFTCSEVTLTEHLLFQLP